jgi:hypothetical protein
MLFSSLVHHPTTRHTLSKKLAARPLLHNTGTSGERLCSKKRAGSGTQARHRLRPFLVQRGRYRLKSYDYRAIVREAEL